MSETTKPTAHAYTIPVTGRIVADQTNAAGEQVRVRFPNGFGASIVRGPYTYGGPAGLFEVAVLVFDDDGWELTYDTDVADDVIGHQTAEDVTALLVRVAALTSTGAAPADVQATPDQPEASAVAPLTGSDYVRAVASGLIAADVAIDLNGADFDEERCSLPVVEFDRIVWLRWSIDPADGWHLDDENGRVAAPICPPDTPVDEAVQILTRYV